MDEASARNWLIEYGVSRETIDRIDRFREFLTDEAARQNLVSKPSLTHFWSRHVVDSAQLLRLGGEGDWIDLGTGAGFPGLIVAALRPGHTVLVEERRLRVAFLESAADILGISGRLTIHGSRVERVAPRPFATISARAFAPLPKLLDLAEKFATPKTIWVLPKGRNAQSELDAVAGTWQGDFRLAPSLTDDDAQIIVARGVRRTGRGGAR